MTTTACRMRSIAGRGGRPKSGVPELSRQRCGSVLVQLSLGFGGKIAGNSSMAKPPLALVAPGSAGLSPPRKLGPNGTALWDAITAEYRIEDAGGIELLTQACQASDRVEALAAAIDADGEIIRTRTGARVHPGLKDEVALRAFIVRTIEKLGLNFEAVRLSAGRPPGR
jgi:hypothetical protein